MTGIVVPAGAALQVVAVRDSQTDTTFPDINGKFTFKNLAPGTYTVVAKPDSGYFTPAPITTTLYRGLQTDIGTIAMSPNRPTTASLHVAYRPMGAATSVKVTNQVSGSTTTIQPSILSTSDYSSFSAQLPAGTYTISVIAADGFQTPSDTSVVMVAGKGYSFPIITMLPGTVTDGGQVSGTLTPAGKATKITIVKSNSLLQYSETPDATGKFSFPNVAPGTYSLSATVDPNSGYLAPASSNLVVNANQRIDLGTINLILDTRAFSYYVDDTIYRKEAYFFGSFVTTKMKITGQANLSGGDFAMILTIEGFKGIGQYICDSTTGTKLEYYEPHNTGGQFFQTLEYKSIYSGGSGMITVTDYNAVTKKISGTFSGTLRSPLIILVYTGRTTKVISKGVFTDIPYY